MQQSKRTAFRARKLIRCNSSWEPTSEKKCTADRSNKKQYLTYKTKAERRQLTNSAAIFRSVRNFRKILKNEPRKSSDFHFFYAYFRWNAYWAKYIFRSEFWHKSTYEHVLRYCDTWMTAKYIAMNDNAYDYYLRIETHVKIFVMSSKSIRWNSSTYVKTICWVVLHANI